MNESPQSTEELSLARVMGTLRRRAGLVILCCLAVAGSALAFSLLQEKQYTASASLLIRDLGLGGGFSSDASREAATNVQLGSAPVVATETADDLDQRLTPDEIGGKVEIQEEIQSNILRVVATDPDPQLAADLANSFAEHYVEFRNEADRAEVRGALRRVESEYEALSPGERDSEVGRPIKRQIGALTAQEAAQTANLEPIQEATVPSAPSTPKVARNTAFGVLLGLLVGIGLALLIERRDRRIRDPIELAGLLGLPLLGGIPQSEAIRFPARDAGEALPYGEAEAFRAIWRRLGFFSIDRELGSILITSTSDGDGKSTVGWNLAQVAADTGLSVLLLESDLHHDSFAAAAGLGSPPGLTEVLSGEARLKDAIQPVTPEKTPKGRAPERRLDVLVTGATDANRARLLETERMSQLLDKLPEAYELVVIDAPVASALPRAMPLVRHATGAIVVGHINKTTRDEMVELRGQLRNIDVPGLGCVANCIPEGRRGLAVLQDGEPDPEVARSRIGGLDLPARAEPAKGQRRSS